MFKLLYLVPVIAVVVAITMKLMGKPIAWWTIVLPVVGCLMMVSIVIAAFGVPGDPNTMSAGYKDLFLNLFVVGACGFVLLIGSTIYLIIKIVKLL